MAHNFYSEIKLHITWHTKESAPLLVPKVQAIVQQYLRGRCINTPGVYIHEIGGIETHVHLSVSIAPTILISDFIGQLKGSSSHEVNQKLAAKVLEWQTGYGESCTACPTPRMPSRLQQLPLVLASAAVGDGQLSANQ